MKPLVNITTFRGYVNRVLPTVYDDSLSYYEVLAKVMEKLNEVIELDNEQNVIINNLPQDVSSFAEELAEFKASMTLQFNEYKAEMNAALDAFEAEVNAKIAADSTPTQGSTKLVTSGGVYAAIQDVINSLVKDALPTQGSANYVTSGGVFTAIQNAVNTLNTTIATKQNALTFDTTPTENSVNPVQSGGIKTYVDTAKGDVQRNLDDYISSNNTRSSAIEGDITALQTGKQNTLTFDQSPTLNSGNPVTSDGIARAIAGATPTIDIDDVPTEGSTNAVSSNGVYQAIETLTTDTEEALTTKQDELTFDLLPTQNSMNPVTSGGVWQKIAEIDPYGTIDPEPTEGSTAAVQSGGTWSALQQLNSTLSAEIDTKQGALTFDNAPTINSGNPVTSDGIYRALQEKQSALTFDSTPTQYSTNPVTSGGVYDAIQQGGGGGGTIDPVPTEGSTHAVQSGGTWTALQGKQDTLTFDSVPTQYSTNPVTSGGVYDAIQQGGGGGTIDPVPTEGSTHAVQSGGTWTALQGKQNTLTFDSTPTENSTNPVTSGGVYAAIQASGGGGGETRTLLFDNNCSNTAQTNVSLTGELLSSTTYDAFDIEYLWFDDSSQGNDLCYPSIIRVKRDTLNAINTDYSGIYNNGVVIEAIDDNYKYYNVYETTDLQDNPITLFEYDSSRSTLLTNITININRIWGVSGTGGGGSSWVLSTPEMHRNIFRGQYLGSSVSAAQLAAIDNGSFDDLYVGDYWTIPVTIDGTTLNVNWRIADIDYYMHTGDTPLEAHHLVIVPDIVLYSARMNSTNINTGGYKASEMYTTNLGTAKTAINTAFPNMVLTHRDMMPVDPSNTPTWADSTVELLSEIMTYGTQIMSPCNNAGQYNVFYTIARSQLSLFRLAPWFGIANDKYWLRDVIGQPSFALVAAEGNADGSGASNQNGIRPYFIIGVPPTANS